MSIVYRVSLWTEFWVTFVVTGARVLFCPSHVEIQIAWAQFTLCELRYWCSDQRWLVIFQDIVFWFVKSACRCLLLGQSETIWVFRELAFSFCDHWRIENILTSNALVHIKSRSRQLSLLCEVEWTVVLDCISISLQFLSNWWFQGSWPELWWVFVSVWRWTFECLFLWVLNKLFAHRASAHTKRVDWWAANGRIRLGEGVLNSVVSWAD